MFERVNKATITEGERIMTIIHHIEQLARLIGSDAYTVASTLADRGLITQKQLREIERDIFEVSE